MKVATYNVNSIRKRLPIVLDWLERESPDIMCLQETKVLDEDFPRAEIEAAGYHAYFRGMKGYNGVAIVSHEPASSVIHGLHEGPDNEDVRLIQAVIGGIPVVNSYVPQGHKVGTDKYAFKLAWFASIRRYFERYLDPAQPALWTGDLNVAPEPVDVYHADRRVNDPDFHIDARNAYKAAVSWGFIDVFRKLYPDRVQYTYWDYFRNAYKNNWGWRIDHILATAPLADRCLDAGVDTAPRESPAASDHTIAWATFR